MNIYYVFYDYRYEEYTITLFAENEVDAQQKADYYMFKNYGKNIFRGLYETKVSIVEPDEYGVINEDFYDSCP